MPSLAGFVFDTWEGALQTPASRGPRLSRVHTSASATDRLQAWTLAYAYGGIKAPFAAYAAVLPGEVPVTGVRVADVTIDAVRQCRGRYIVLATWSLVWG